MRGSFFFSYIQHNNIKCKNLSHLLLHYCPLLSPIVGIHWCFDALEVAYCPNVEVKRRQERELSEFGDLQLSSWISCWTRIHVSNSIFMCYSSSLSQGEMTTSLWSQSERRWWMRLITLFPCLWIFLVKNFAMPMLARVKWQPLV